MRLVKVGFSRPRAWFKPFSWAIRLVDWTPYSHVYVSFYSATYDRRLVYQASSVMVNFFGPEAWAEEAVVVREFDLEISDEAYRRFMQFAIDNAGLPYDLASVFGLAWVKLMAVFGKKVGNPLGNRKGAFFCSKLVASIMEDAFGDDLPGFPEDMTPRDIYEYLEGAKS
jgi:hypothetical protein